MKHFIDFGSIFDEAMPSQTHHLLAKTPAQKERSRKTRVKWEAAYQKRSEWEPEDYENEDQRLRAEVEAILAKRQQL
jgi:hypothetical protein